MALAIVASAIATCSRPAPRVHTVAIRNFAFDPADVPVAVGDTVVWTNADFVPHTATALDRSWDSQPVAANATWRFVATTPGRHEYYCVLHQTMKAAIVVR